MANGIGCTDPTFGSNAQVPPRPSTQPITPAVGIDSCREPGCRFAGVLGNPLVQSLLICRAAAGWLDQTAVGISLS